MRFEVFNQPRFLENLPIPRLKKILSDLKEASDIEGAAIVEERGNLIVHNMPDALNYEAEIPLIMTQVKDWSDFGVYKKINPMFAHCILDYNGWKILAKKLKGNLTLLVMLQKQGFIGLAMLDIENSIRRIDEILRVTVSTASN